MKNNQPNYAQFTLDMLSSSYSKPNVAIYKPLVNQPLYSSADKIVTSGIADNQYRSNFNNQLDSKTRASENQVSLIAAQLVSKITKIAEQLKESIGNPQLEAYYNGHGMILCRELGNYYLSQAKNNKDAYQKTCQKWIELGNKFLKYTTYDFMREKGMLPPIQQIVQNVQQEEIEDEEMLNELREQLKQLKLQAEQKDKALADRDQIIVELTEKNNNLVNQVEELTEKLNFSEEMNLVLQNKFEASEAKVKPLEEKVIILNDFNKQLKEDKLELREDKKMLIEDKKLLLVDKKLFQDLSQEQAIKITQLEQIHCNDPNHINLLNNDFEILEHVEIVGNLNELD